MTAVNVTYRKMTLPEVFEPPLRFGAFWGCLTQGAFKGIDAVVTEFRYVLPYSLAQKTAP
ncbi:hypothetical protein [Pyrobaculum aerophilum]|uniref:PaREP2a n=1 Tax=Pyrobaculum aerophilum (strain ATCC 51768 / DSM 7523 / JCM 9630 / CIP 104966 / NBRC 100827 / IM2) TaxID=178306 RepID=Q8ZYC0_PYRAE|nr:hypothetical protein [Pyrobaculum aerophilum]AAL63075.1 paREP2a [Pyrobaculum aerophilum str. IM2]